MTKLQFRVLYRQFLFRMVDLELLSASAQGDVNKLLGQFGSLLIFLSALFSLGAMRSMVFGSKVTFHPLGAEPESWMSSAGAVPVLVMTTGTVVSLPAEARVETRPSRPLMSIRGWPVMLRPRSAVAEASSAATRAVTL